MEKLTDKQKELLKNCKYYKGEEECPFEEYPASWYWDLERVYIQDNGEFSGERAVYEAYKFKVFNIPRSLLIVMFTSWAKTAYDISKEIPDFYGAVEQYMSDKPRTR